MDVATAQRSHTPPPADALPGTRPSGVRLREYFAADPGRTVLQAGVALVLVAAVVRGWAASRGWLFSDDLIFQAKAVEASLTDVDYLTQPYNGHLMPGAFAVAWVLTRLDPHGYAHIAATAAAMHAVAGVLLLLVLRRLVGTSPLALLPLAVGVLGTLTLPMTLWWAVSLNQQPQLVLSLLAVLAHLRYLQGGRVRDGVLGAAAIAVGLLFSERTLLVLPLLVLLTAWWASPVPGPLRSLVDAARRHARVWAAHAAVLVPYAGYYAWAVPSPVADEGTDLALVVSTVFEGVTYSLPSALVGGPWTWMPTGGAGAVPADPAAVRVLAALAVAVLVAATVRRQPRAARAWAVAGLYLLGNALLVAVTRAPAIGEVIGREYRYFTELATVLPLALALALLPARLPGAPLPTRPAPRRLPSLAAWAPLGDAVRRRRSAAVAAACLLLVVATTASVARHDPAWSQNPSRAWVDRARAELAAAPGVVHLDAPVPETVQSALTTPWNSASRVLRPVVPPERFLQPGQAVPDVRVLDDTGASRPVGLDARLDAGTGPAAGCGWRVTGGDVQVRLPFPSYPGAWAVRVAYLASAASPAVLTVDGVDAPVTLQPGLHALWTVADGRVDGVTLSGVAAGTQVCVTELAVGRPVPLPAP